MMSNRPILSKRREILSIILLFAAVLVTRWVVRVEILNNFDAVNYALAIDNFDVRLHQTQPPGYYAYIVAVRIIHLLAGDHLAALTLFSTLASGLGVLLVFLVGKEIFGSRTGLIAASLLVISTMFWFQGAIAAPYTGDLALSVLIAWLCYRSQKKGGASVLWAALALGVGGAYRPQTLFFLAPLLAFALWGRSWKLWLAAGFTSGITAILLFSPAIIDSGGLKEYLGAVFNITDTTTSTHQASYGYWRYLGYLLTTAKITFLAIGEAIILFVFLGLWHSRRQHQENLFLILWVLPTWIVFCLLYPGNPGTILVCIAPFFLWAGRGFASLLEKERWQRTGWGILGAVIIWQISLFAWLPHDFLPYRSTDNASMLELTESFFTNRLELTAQYPPQESFVLAENYRHIQYYLPEYTACLRPILSTEPETIHKMTCSINGQVQLTWDLDVAQILPENTRYVIYFDYHPEFVPASEPWLEEISQNGQSIWVMEVSPGEQAIWTAEGLIFKP